MFFILKKLIVKLVNCGDKTASVVNFPIGFPNLGPIRPHDSLRSFYVNFTVMNRYLMNFFGAYTKNDIFSMKTEFYLGSCFTQAYI